MTDIHVSTLRSPKNGFFIENIHFIGRRE